MGTSVLSDAKKDLFFYTTEGNFAEVKRIITDSKLPVNCYDAKGMTPLQHAAFKGHYDICKLLLDCGADVNDNKDMYGYSPLSLAALSNHCEVLTLLLEYGANPSAINSNKRTAAEMASFVGNHKPANIINNYLKKDAIEYFAEIHGLESEPRLPRFLCNPVHKFVIMPTIHPVRLILYLRANNVILQNLKYVIDVLNIMAEKQLKDMANERLSLKLHHYAFVLSSISDFLLSQKKESSEEEISDEKILDVFIKSLLKGHKDGDEISINLEKFLRKGVSAYPFDSCLLYRKIVSTISATDLGDEPNALAILNNAILGQQSFDSKFCATCGDESSLKQCLGCHKVHYCDKTCQKLHWFVHKNECKK